MIGAQRRWREDCGGSDRDGQADIGGAVRSEAEAGDCFFLLASMAFYFLAGWSAEEGTAYESLPLPQFV